MLTSYNSLPAVLEDNLRGGVLVLHQGRDEVTLHLRTLTKHRLDGYLERERQGF